MVGGRGSANLEILRKICRRWLKGVGEMKEICVVSKRGIGMKKKFEFILKFQRVSFFFCIFLKIWDFGRLEDDKKEVYKFDDLKDLEDFKKVKKIAKGKKFENFTNFNILANRHKKQCFNSNRE